MEELSCRVETSFEALEPFRHTWDEAVVRLGGSIYMSYDWSRIWWEFYGDGKELRIFIFTHGQETVGILPLYIDSLGCWPLRLKVARLVGANIPPKVFNPPIHPTWAEAAFGVVLTRLFEKESVDLLSYGPVSELHHPTELLQRACEKRQGNVTQRTIAGEVHSTFLLPPSLEEYFEGLSKAERKKRKYELRLLQKECSVLVDVVSNPVETGPEFERFAEQHTAQWQAEGKTGHFGAWPKGKEFNAALVKAQAALGRVRFVRIIANRQVLSNQYVFAFGDAFFWELPARALGRQWERLSLGPAGLISTIESAIQEGKKQVEGGLGHYDYKVKMGAQEHAVRRVHVVANRAGSRVRRTLFGAIRFCVLYGYHKLWYRRIAPHLPAPEERPQWNFWLRLDF
jgi:CelD/BcsL family acetyltransferase involved in cellulose biosynthesis